MEIINDLLGYKNKKIVQNTQMFSFSLDSILLPNFIDFKTNYNKILDIGTGNVPIPLILSTKTRAKIDAIELQKEVYDLAKKTIEINNLGDQINLINDNVINWYKTIETDTYDLITCNPPYFKNSNIGENNYKILSRHEEDLNIENLLKISKKILKNGGKVALVHRTNRLIEIIEVMKKYNIEPKRCRFVYPKHQKDSNILLIEGTKNGRTGFKLEKPLYVHNDDGSYTDEVTNFFK